MQGCECHEQQCIQARAKHALFVCPEGRKSMKGPVVRHRIESLLIRLQAMQVALSSGETLGHLEPLRRAQLFGVVTYVRGLLLLNTGGS